ncbi:hypothetical protein BB561_002635 [Smittium simulii]|uniref:DIS3-like exonuclease 1 n=1 Tax=Smittium simulii TaxID=133385 RepID=A0A2T9YPQ3_9FUNG|nr:hypothetical protein BB561_002635 [Smittium simulii]
MLQTRRSQANQLKIIQDNHYTKSKKIGASKIAREKYLRMDIGCKIKGCLICGAYNQQYISPLLDLVDKDLFILGVDVSIDTVLALSNIIDTAASRFIVCLDWPEITNFIIPQTLIDALDYRNRTRSIKKLRSFIADLGKKCIYFPNTSFYPTFRIKSKAESSTEFDTRGTNYIQYCNHYTFSYVLLTKIPDNSINSVDQIDYVKFENYVKLNCPNRIQEFESIKAATESGDMDISDTTLEEYLASKSSKKNSLNHTTYLSTLELEDGLLNKSIFQGTIKYRKIVSKYKDQIATVTLSSQNQIPVWLVGDFCINRAIDGDTVAVKYLTKDEISMLEIESMIGDTKNQKNETFVETVEDTETTEVGEEITEENYLNPANNFENLLYCKVVAVINRNWDPIVATIQIDDRYANYHFAVPLNKKLPKIIIYHSNVIDIEKNRIIVIIDDWQIGNRYPDGHFVRSIGKIGDLETELSALLVENKISLSQSDLYFSEQVLNEMPNKAKNDRWKPSYNQKGRRNITDKVIFSIDPVGSKDIDDAISFEKITNSKTGTTEYELGVHIADVTEFVKPGSATDLEARKRGTTIYMADRRFNMVPEILSEDLCSLRSNADRYAVSVIWKMDASYNIKSVWFGKTLINSKCEMSYESAQLILNSYSKNKDNNPKIDQKYSLGLRVFNFTQAMKTLRAKRIKNGALELESNEISFAFNEDKKIASIKPKQKLEIHSVIEEAMIMANCEVAKRILKTLKSSAMLRIHVDPIEQRFQSIKELAIYKGFDIDTSSNLSLSKSLKEIEKNTGQKNSKFISFLKSMTILALSEASYVSSGTIPSSRGFKHYGLAVDTYTHFTSPIRRYSDIIVHRQLLQCLSDIDEISTVCSDMSKINLDQNFAKKSEIDLNSLTEIKAITDHLNIKNRNSKKIQRASATLFQTKYFMDLISEIRGDNTSFMKTAIITGICINGLKAKIPDLGITGSLSFQKMGTPGSPQNDYVMLPLSILTFKVEDAFKRIPFCRIVEANKIEIKVELPSFEYLQENMNSITENMFKSNTSGLKCELVSLKLYPDYLKQHCKLSNSQTQNKTSMKKIENKSVIISYKVLEEIVVFINVKTSEYSLPEIYFELVRRSVSESGINNATHEKNKIIDLDKLEKRSESDPLYRKSKNGILDKLSESINEKTNDRVNNSSFSITETGNEITCKTNISTKKSKKIKAALEKIQNKSPNSLYCIIDKFQQMMLTEHTTE